MTDLNPITLSGAPGSPYTRKMLAVLRYRRIPYRFVIAGSAAAADLPKPKVQLLPTFYLPGPSGAMEAVVDSSPLIRRLEAEIAGRSIIPPDPALAFLDMLIEDYADEWLTKPMFHYRWRYKADIAKAAKLLPATRGVSIPDATLTELADSFSARQIGRLSMVGSNDVTAPIIEASYRRFLLAFEAHLTGHPFLLGARPSACDFAVYGQLTQLAGFDPTPMALAVELAPRVCAWVGLVEDLSGLEPGDWLPSDDLPGTLCAVLTEIGRVYPPVMRANAEAVSAGAATVEAEIDGKPWVQQPFPYQAKCLHWLRQAHAALPVAARATVNRALEPAGLLPLLA